MTTEVAALPKQDWRKVFIGAALAGAGALVAFLIEILPSVSLGLWAPIVGAGLSVLTNLIRKYHNNYKLNNG